MGTGTLDQFEQFLDEETAYEPVNMLVYMITFTFYFCCYLVIVFFNTALSACAMKMCAGEAPIIGYGLGISVKRLPQIIGWSLVSATVGIILKSIENSHKRVGLIVAALIGAVCTALTYFLVPVLAVEGVGPIQAFKKSVGTMKDT